MRSPLHPILLFVLVLVWPPIPAHAEPPTENPVVDLTGTEPTERQIIDALRSSEPPLDPPRARGMSSAAKGPSSAPRCSVPQGTRGMSTSVRKIAPGSRPVAILVNFASGSAELLPEGQRALGTLARSLASPELSASCIRIEGHTDSMGVDDFNQRLSLRRAEAVLEYLVLKLGVDRQRLVAVGLGEHTPLATNLTEEGRFTNRRVQFANFGYEQP